MQVLFAGWKQTGSKHTTHSGLLKQSMVRGQNTAVSTDKPKDQSLKKSCFLSSYGVRGQRFGDERSAVQCAVCWWFPWAAGKGPQQGSASIASLLWSGGGWHFLGFVSSAFHPNMKLTPGAAKAESALYAVSDFGGWKTTDKRKTLHLRQWMQGLECKIKQLPALALWETEESWICKKTIYVHNKFTNLWGIFNYCR